MTDIDVARQLLPDPGDYRHHRGGAEEERARPRPLRAQRQDRGVVCHPEDAGAVARCGGDERDMGPVIVGAGNVGGALGRRCRSLYV